MSLRIPRTNFRMELPDQTSYPPKLEKLPRSKLPDFNRDIYYKNKLEYSLWKWDGFPSMSPFRLTSSRETLTNCILCDIRWSRSWDHCDGISTISGADNSSGELRCHVHRVVSRQFREGQRDAISFLRHGHPAEFCAARTGGSRLTLTYARAWDSSTQRDRWACILRRDRTSRSISIWAAACDIISRSSLWRNYGMHRGAELDAHFERKFVVTTVFELRHQCLRAYVWDWTCSSEKHGRHSEQ